MGLDIADRMCYEQAKAMGLPPNYRAFISSHRQDLVHVVYPGFRDILPVTNLRVSLLKLPELNFYHAEKELVASDPLCVLLGRRDV